MRWIWIDRILTIDRGKRCVAIKNVSLAEDVVHDHFAADEHRPAWPIFPQSLIVEGMAQTAGVLVGHARDFAHLVVLAKISRAHFHQVARPGLCLRYTAVIDRLDDSGAATKGTVELIDPADPAAAPSPVAEIDLMFSHLDQSRAALLDLPKHNFIFTGQLLELMRQSGLPA